jgi:hypothetical protein
MCSSAKNNFPIGIRIPDSRRAALERAAAMRGLSVANPEQTLGGEAEHLGTSQAVNNRSAA